MVWWKSGVIYQIYPRSFMDSNGDGIGDLGGVLQKLDYLKWLGVDAIWFSPVFPSPQADWGYDVANYTDIHHEYGTLAQFDTLLVEAHSRDMKILLDLVPNHTSVEHEWFVESRSNRDNPRRDWYIWKDPKPDGTPPNNWLSYFGGPAWTLDERTGQYYMHNFDPGQPELNWRNPNVQEAIFGAIRFWLNRGVDGFRIDVIDRVLKDPDFRDNPPNPRWKPGEVVTWSLSRVHSENAPGTHDMMKKFRAVFDEFEDRVSVGEIAYEHSAQQQAEFYGEAVHPEQGDELHLPFNFGLLMREWDAEIMREYIDEYDNVVPTHGWPNYVLGNHDAPRIASKYGATQAKVAGLMLLTLRGTPTLYYGDELGMHNVTIPEERILDPQGRNKAGFNRDECRTPMQWDATHNAGFSTANDTWLPVAPDYATMNVTAQTDDPASTLNFYRRALNYRKQTPALHSGRYYSVDDAPDDVFAYWRQFNDQRRLVVLNFASEPRTLSMTDAGSGKIAISTTLSREGVTVDLKEFTVQGDEGIVIEVE